MSNIQEMTHTKLSCSVLSKADYWMCLAPSLPVQWKFNAQIKLRIDRNLNLTAKNEHCVDICVFITRSIPQFVKFFIANKFHFPFFPHWSKMKFFHGEIFGFRSRYYTAS